MHQKKKTYPQECKMCHYKWEARIPEPVSCPRCKARKDYQEGRKILKKTQCSRCSTK